MIRDNASSRDPSPNFRSSYYEQGRSRENSPETQKRSTVYMYQGTHNTSYIPRSREPSPSTKSYMPRSRDPSPEVKRSSYLYPRSREPSPAEVKRNPYYEEMKKAEVARAKVNEAKKSAVQEFLLEKKAPPVTYKNVKSREPSPVQNTSRFLQNSNKRPPSRDPSPVGHYGSTTSGFSSSFSKNSTPKISTSISYMTASEAKTSRARTVSTSSKASISGSPDHYEKTNKEIQQISKQIEALCNGNDSEESESTSETEEEKEEKSSFVPKIMVKVDVVQRGTSPTHPNTGTKTRRTDSAKTLAKTIMRPLHLPKMVDKETQSDRMDDSTRARYLSSTAYSPTPYKNFSSRSTSSNNSSRRYTPITSSSEHLNQIDKSRKSSLSGKSSDQSRNGSQQDLRESPSKKSNIPSKSVSRQGSSETKNGSQIPVKAASPATTNGCIKLANKDFRKSVLNMGSSEESRSKKTTGESRSSSTESDSSSSTGSPPVQKTRGSQRTSVSVDELPTDVTEEPTSFIMRAFGSKPKFEFRKRTPPEESEWLGSKAETIQNHSEETYWNGNETINGPTPESMQNGSSSENNLRWLNFNGSSSDVDSSKPAVENHSESRASERSEVDFWATLKKDTPEPTRPQVYNYFPPEEKLTNGVKILPGPPGHINIVYGHQNGVELGDRASPEGLEALKSPNEVKKEVFISRHHNIDDLLGGGCQPITERMFDFEGGFQEISPDQVKIHESHADLPRRVSEQFFFIFF